MNGLLSVMLMLGLRPGRISRAQCAPGRPAMHRGFKAWCSHPSCTQHTHEQQLAFLVSSAPAFPCQPKLGLRAHGFRPLPARAVSIPSLTYALAVPFVLSGRVWPRPGPDVEEEAGRGPGL